MHASARVGVCSLGREYVGMNAHMHGVRMCAGTGAKIHGTKTKTKSNNQKIIRH